MPAPFVQSYAERCQIFTDGLFVVAHFYCMGFYMIYKADYNEFARNMLYLTVIYVSKSKSFKKNSSVTNMTNQIKNKLDSMLQNRKGSLRS